MADGLRLLGSCPKCGGELEFHAPASAPASFTDHSATDPHMVLGIPRL